GGAVSSPAMPVLVCMVHDGGYMFVTGPEVVRGTTGEEVTFDQLGGAEVHNTRSGVAHFLAQDEQECFEQTRRLLTFLPQNSESPPPYRVPTADPERADPGLATIIPDAPPAPYELRDVSRM